MPLADATQTEAPAQRGRAHPGAVRVVAPARLHLGFLDLNGGLGRMFGSIGLAVDVTNQILQTGKVTRAFLGIGFRDVDEVLARQFNLPVDEGVVVTGLAPSAPAARAGLREGDIITGVNGTKIAQGGDLRRILRAHRPGDTLTLQVRRPEGETEMKVRLMEAPQF